MSLVFLNGEWLPIDQAKISVLDRGFIFGDGIYEVIPVYEHKPYRLPQHLKRLAYSLNGIRIPNPYTDEQWTALTQQLIAHHDHLPNQAVYIQLTRGVAPRGHAFPTLPVSPTVFMMSNLLKRPSEEMIENGITAVSLEDQRWLHCDYKTTALLGNVLACQYAVEHDAVEVIQFRHGHLSEGSSSNVLVVKDGTLYTPQKNHLILHGITMEAVIEKASILNIPVKQMDIPEELVRNADELWITSSSKEVVAVTSFDGCPVSGGKPGLIYKKVYKALQQEITDL